MDRDTLDTSSGFNARFRFFDEQRRTAYILPLKGELPAPEDEEEWYFDHIIEEAGRIEELYGVHDVSMVPGEELLGFSSYEVGQDAIEQWEGCLGEWRKVLERLGFEVGPLQTIENAEE